MKPKKQGLDYYPVDVNFLSDYSVQVLMKRCGLQALAVLMELQGRIYQKEGYFIAYNKELVFFVANSFSLSEEEVENIINKAVDCKIFDKAMFDKYQILTSKEIQEVFIFATKRRKGNEMCTEYLLVEDKCIQDPDKCIQDSDSTTPDVYKNEQIEIEKEKEIETEKETKNNNLNKNLKENVEGEGGEKKAAPPTPPAPAWMFNFLEKINSEFWATCKAWNAQKKQKNGQKFGTLEEYPYFCVSNQERFGLQKHIKELAAKVDWKTHQIKQNSEISVYWEWRAAAFGPCFAQRITNLVKHSNPILRSFFISACGFSFLNKEKVYLCKSYLFS